MQKCSLRFFSAPSRFYASVLILKQGINMRHVLVAILLLLPLLSFGEEQKLSYQEYQLLKKAFEHLEKGQLSQAYQQLTTAKAQVNSDYARALVEHNLGQVEVQRERYRKALPHLLKAYNYKQLPQAQQTDLTHTLAQLHCMQDQWKTCINYLKKWMRLAPSKVKTADQLLLAQAYSQLEQWKNVIKPISAAITRRKIAPENWYQLKLAAHVQLKQWRAAAKEQKRLVRYYSNKVSHWRQLVSLQLQAGHSKAALATQRMGFERGLLRQAKDYRLLAQLMLQARIPYYAGKVMETGMKRGVLKRNKKNLRLLSNCWIQARETKKAIKTLSQLNQSSPSQKSLTQLAQMQMELQDWQAAQSTLKKTLGFTKKKPAKLQLLLGITHIKLKQYDQARQTLAIAAKDKKQQASARGWMQYLEQIIPQPKEVNKEG